MLPFAESLLLSRLPKKWLRFALSRRPMSFRAKKPGKPFYDLTRCFEKAVAKAKLGSVTFHTLRHTAASHMVMAGVDITSVKEFMRHKSITITLRYAHLSPGHQMAAVDALANALRVKEQNGEKDVKTP